MTGSREVILLRRNFGTLQRRRDGPAWGCVVDVRQNAVIIQVRWLHVNGSKMRLQNMVLTFESLAKTIIVEEIPIMTDPQQYLESEPGPGLA